MKHYLTRAQMRELAEIGIDTRALATHECTEDRITYFSLSIGDLIGMLPKEIFPAKEEPEFNYLLTIKALNGGGWHVIYGSPLFHWRCAAPELINALFDMLVRLKKEGMI